MQKSLLMGISTEYRFVFFHPFFFFHPLRNSYGNFARRVAEKMHFMDGIPSLCLHLYSRPYGFSIFLYSSLGIFSVKDIGRKLSMEGERVEFYRRGFISKQGRNLEVINLVKSLISWWRKLSRYTFVCSNFLIPMMVSLDSSSSYTIYGTNHPSEVIMS